MLTFGRITLTSRGTNRGGILGRALVWIGPGHRFITVWKLGPLAIVVRPR